jgi:hypothetical protein
MLLVVPQKPTHKKEGCKMWQKATQNSKKIILM